MKREVKKEHIEFGDHFSRGERTRDCDLSGGFKRKGKREDSIQGAERSTRFVEKVRRNRRTNTSLRGFCHE